MPSPAPRPAPDPSRHGLVAHTRPDAIAAWRHGEAIDAARFLADVDRVAGALPGSRHVLNFCADRYRFAVALCAAIVRGQTTLLPPATTPNVLRAMRDFAADAYCVSDDAAFRSELPRFELPPPCAAGEGAVSFEVPQVEAGQVVACVFTSGSTGEPQPHFKHWGPMVRNVAGAARRLQVGPGHAILGTVPPQHMYGLESTVLLPLLAGAALTARRPYYPADIDAAIAALAPPRVMFTTPFHLRTWLDGGGGERLERIVSATAPLSASLARRAEERTGAEVLEIYGCTETGQVATRRTAREDEWHAYEGLRVWNEGAQAMVDGAHVERPTALMDVIEVRGAGDRFVLHGRSADMVNIAGKRNSLGYLDHQLVSIAGVDDGAFLLPDETEPDGVTRLMAFAVAPGLTSAQVMAGLRERVDPAFLPRPLVMVASLPRAATGKLPRAALLALAASARKTPSDGA